MTKLYCAVIISLFLVSNISKAVPSTMARSSVLNRAVCQPFHQILNKQWQELDNIYKKVDPTFTKLTKQNSPYLFSGTNSDLVILIHGYLGSPFEMNRMAEALKTKGYSVLNDLIPGFGYSARIANQFTQEYWDKYFDVRYKLAFQCFKRVHFIGFSTGGLISHKFLMTNPKLTAASVHLISPFFSPTLKFVSFLTQWFSWFKTEIPLSALYISTFGAKELKIMLMYPDYYLHDAPYLNINEIIKSGQSVVDYPTKIKNDSAVFLYATSKDLVMDYEITKSLINRDFKNSRLIDYSNSQAPHHLFRPEVSDVAMKFERYLLSFF